jgi:hypothetical protein
MNDKSLILRNVALSSTMSVIPEQYEDNKVYPEPTLPSNLNEYSTQSNLNSRLQDGKLDKEKRCNITNRNNSNSTSHTTSSTALLPTEDTVLGMKRSMFRASSTDGHNVEPTRLASCSKSTDDSCEEMNTFKNIEVIQSDKTSKKSHKRFHSDQRDSVMVEHSIRPPKKRANTPITSIKTPVTSIPVQVKSSSRSKTSAVIHENFRERQILKNEREKERSFRIAKQITDLQQLLSYGGVQCATGTRRCVLDEAINYIQELQKLLSDSKR